MGPKKAETEKKTVTRKTPPDHPPYQEMIRTAIQNLKDRSGSSRQAIKKYISANYKVGDNSNNQVNLAIKRGVASGDFLQPKGPSGPVKIQPPVRAERAVTKKKPGPVKKVGAPKKAAAATTKKVAAAPKKKAPKKAPAAKVKKTTTRKTTAAAAPKKKATTTKKTTTKSPRKAKAV